MNPPQGVLQRVRAHVSSALATSLVASIYALTLVIARVGRRARRTRRGRSGCLVVVGTFFNRGWFLSHVTPLARAGIDQLIVVTDEPQTPIERVRFLCPSPWAVLLFGRTIPKFACVVVAALSYDADVYMGYHIMPCAVMALVVARIFGRPASYQMTGGPVEVLCGGAQSENRVLRLVGASGRHVEPLAIRLVREFDQIIVRGASAQRFLVSRGVADGVIDIIPGSVDPALMRPGGAPTHDLIFVGRLVEIKQPLKLVDIVAGVSGQHPSTRILIVGDGPLKHAMCERAAALGVMDRLDFAGKTDQVQTLMRRGRIFVLTSRTEGLSIAMAEAMMAGVVPVVANVGDLGDLVLDGVNGYLVEPSEIDGYVRRICGLLSDPALCARLSAAARASARDHVGVDHVTGLWETALNPLLAPEVAHRAPAPSPIADCVEPRHGSVQSRERCNP